MCDEGSDWAMLAMARPCGGMVRSSTLLVLEVKFGQGDNEWISSNENSKRAGILNGYAEGFWVPD